MEPKDMTLGELVCEYIHAYVDGRLNVDDRRNLYKKVNELRTELVVQLNLCEINKQREKEDGQKPIS